MRLRRVDSAFLGLTLMMLAFSTLAQAQATRTWVSGVGDDANPCSRTAPCKTFAGAIAQTTAGGEIDCLDPGGFGALTITKAITIDCNSGVGSVLVAGTNGINVEAGPNDVVYIKNLDIDGLGAGGGTVGLSGIVYVSGKALFLRNVDVFGFESYCVDAQTGAANGQLTIDNSSLSNCGAASINISTTGSSLLSVDIHSVRIWDTPVGISAGYGARVNVRDSVITMATIGVADQPGPSTVLVTGSTISFCDVALQSAVGGFIGATGNSFANNSGTVFNTNGGTILSGGDNSNFGNVGVGTVSGTLSKI